MLSAAAGFNATAWVAGQDVNILEAEGLGCLELRGAHGWVYTGGG